MVAARLPSSQRTLGASSDNGGRTTQPVTDDDGEKGGSRAILAVMETARAMGVCVVGRWYGGVMLGPVRFRHIEAVAGDALLQGLHALPGPAARGLKRVLEEGGSGEQDAVKKTKSVAREEEEKERKVLVAELRERDGSIVVLRELSISKTEQLARLDQPKDSHQVVGATRGPEKHASSSALSTKVPTQDSYDTMELSKLRGVERARDKTVSFLLKRIEGLEKDIYDRSSRKGQSPEADLQNRHDQKHVEKVDAEASTAADRRHTEAMRAPVAASTEVIGDAEAKVAGEAAEAETVGQGQSRGP